MRELKALLASGSCRGVARSSSGELRLFRRQGVADLMELVTSCPDFLRGASVADNVIGRGAAMLLLKGGATEVYARVISSGALSALRSGGVSVSFDTEVDHIANRSGDGICPVERLTADALTPDEAYERIRLFIERQQSK